MASAAHVKKQNTETKLKLILFGSNGNLLRIQTIGKFIKFVLNEQKHTLCLRSTIAWRFEGHFVFIYSV